MSAAPVVLATCAALPGLDADDAPLLDALAARGVPTRILAWDDPSVAWDEAALVVIRSTWDYPERREEFVAWAQRAQQGTTLWNPAAVVAWNTDKRYLQALDDDGVPTVPTRWLDAGADAELTTLVRDAGWSSAVLKPAVSAGARGTVRFAAAQAEDLQRHLDDLLASGDVMVQPYLPRIEVDGEVSIMMVDGGLTHAVRKLPGAGDFRIHEQFGGRNQPTDLSDDLRAVAEHALSHAEHCRYGRVDVVRGPDGGWLVIELELVEPRLFLRHHPPAADRLADAIASAWAGHTTADRGAA